MMFSRLLAAALVSISLLRPALAADAIFPPGVRIGLAPLVGLSNAKTFSGFESEDKSVKVLLTELPAKAYGEVKNAFAANPSGAGGIKPENIETAAGTAYYTVENGRDGVNPVRRYSMILPGVGFSGYVAVQIPETASRIYTDDAVRQMFASAIVRKEVPVDEQLSIMPFNVSELSGFKTVRILGAGALILADGDEEKGFEAAPFVVIGLVAGVAPEAGDRGRVAQQAATSIPGVREARITMSEPIRIDGLPAYETRIEATSGKDNTPVTIVQWLRFGGPNTLRIIGSAPRDQWSAAFPRFRAVRDGIQPKG
ncbi:hypothetical protein SSBR45G_25430 [Bradyrhizobium sp. SSBR45G]|uniref:hypothetical protein n=1 Tax=unclassified Bradyrhizobium TaxID=2631580 RepID=UPI00234299F8|nr:MULTISPECIES: hypothetical protein [unclassified Bradyrhizobium]GLH77635.1 hypothetical protein SSBR45G_25430 [Bradyrhizobium sp. SSBR45G]GLH84872.1 hypothetical protein SSBR45R_23320 [Bradyrhizobium sp. SSBR45R]